MNHLERYELARQLENVKDWRPAPKQAKCSVCGNGIFRDELRVTKEVGQSILCVACKRIRNESKETN